MNSMKIKTIPANVQIYNYIKEAITSGEWKVNERIPSETVLAETFGVNRLTVRMALKQLVAIGILETKTGDGTYVREFHFSDYISQIADFFITPELIQSVSEFRKTIEPECVRLAIEVATDEEIEELCVICDEYQDIKSGYSAISLEETEEFLQEFCEKDWEFHSKIVSMSHNELFIYSFEIAKEPIFKYIKALMRKRIDTWNKRGIHSSNWNDQHREICDAIKSRDYSAYSYPLLQMVDFAVEL